MLDTDDSKKLAQKRMLVSLCFTFIKITRNLLNFEIVNEYKRPNKGALSVLINVVTFSFQDNWVKNDRSSYQVEHLEQ